MLGGGLRLASRLCDWDVPQRRRLSALCRRDDDVYFVLMYIELYIDMGVMSNGKVRCSLVWVDVFIVLCGGFKERWSLL